MKLTPSTAPFFLPSRTFVILAISLASALQAAPDFPPWESSVSPRAIVGPDAGAGLRRDRLVEAVRPMLAFPTRSGEL